MSGATTAQMPTEFTRGSSGLSLLSNSPKPCSVPSLGTRQAPRAPGELWPWVTVPGSCGLASGPRRPWGPSSSAASSDTARLWKWALPPPPSCSQTPVSFSRHTVWDSWRLVMPRFSQGQGGDTPETALPPCAKHGAGAHSHFRLQTTPNSPEIQLNNLLLKLCATQNICETQNVSVILHCASPACCIPKYFPV